MLVDTDVTKTIVRPDMMVGGEPLLTTVSWQHQENTSCPRC